MKHVPLLLSLAFFFVGCNTGDDLDSSSGGGDLTVALTDAARDEVASFEIGVEGIVLLRDDETEVSVLSEGLTVDLVDLVDLSQVLDETRLLAGIYTRATITLDLDVAEVWLVGEEEPADLLDGNGVALTGELSLPLDLPANLSGSEDTLLEFDVDLDQSVRVDGDNNAVFFEPVVLARADPTDGPSLMLGGTGLEFDSSTNRIQLQVQTPGRTDLYVQTVAVNADTAYHVNGFAFQGLAGLQALASQQTDTWMQAFGSFSGTVFEAELIEAGRGSFNGGTGMVLGNVVERIGGFGANATLLVRGRSRSADNTSFQINEVFTVSTSLANTQVARRGAFLNVDTDQVNIGQRVRVFGNLSGTNLDASTIDGVLRMEPTRALGFAADSPSGGVLEIELERVGLLDESLFQWSDGGGTPPDPDSFLANVGSEGSSLQAASAVELVGYFTGLADTGPDFEAEDVIDRDEGASLLFLSDRPDGHTVVVNRGEDDVEFTVAGTPALGEFALIDQGFVGSVDLPDDPTPTVEGTGFVGLYFVRDRDTQAVSLHLTFESFLEAWEDAETGGAQLYNFTAIGSYSDSDNTVTALLATLVVD